MVEKGFEFPTSILRMQRSSKISLTCTSSQLKIAADEVGVTVDKDTVIRLQLVEESRHQQSNIAEGCLSVYPGTI